MPESNGSMGTEDTINESSRSAGFHINDFESTREITENSELETDETDTPPTPDYILEALDKIVVYLTGRFYFTHVNVGAKFKNYIKDYDFNVNIMGTFLRNARRFLPDEGGIIRQFEGGFMSSWESVIRELKYFFEMDYSEKTIIDLFNDLQDIAMKKDTTFNLLSKMRLKIKKYFI